MNLTSILSNNITNCGAVALEEIRTASISTISNSRRRIRRGISGNRRRRIIITGIGGERGGEERREIQERREQEIEVQEQEVEEEEEETELEGDINDYRNSYHETNYITDQLSSFNLSNNTRIDYLSWEQAPRSSGERSFSEEQGVDERVGIRNIVHREEEPERNLPGAGGMPRSKRRAPSSTNHHHHSHHNSTSDMPPSAHEEGMPRHPTKRLRHTSSARRYTKTEDVSSASSYSQKRCVAWFREYTTPDDPDTLGPEGMEKFCEDIGVEPENVVMLVLAYKMNARQMGFFSLNEWLKGLSELQCDSIVKVQQKLEHLRNQLNEPHTFKGIYRYAYDFARDKDQRSMDMETARVMLQLLLGKHWPLFAQFNQFLDQSKYKVINKDQWCNILEFSRTISHDLSNYDLDGAWPVMLDEFVEWLKVQRSEGGGNITSIETRGS